MATTLHLVLITFAVVLFLLAAFGVRPSRCDFVALDLAFLTIALWLH